MENHETDELAVFESTGQAIHVAYAILAQPAFHDNMTRRALMGMLTAMPFLPPRLSLWLDRLRGSPSETVHFEGLSPYDVRAQCSMVISAVRTKLPPPEMWALQAKYAGMVEAQQGRARRQVFSEEKAIAIRSLSTWLLQTSAFELKPIEGDAGKRPVKAPEPPFKGIPVPAMDCMVAKFYAHHKQTKAELSYRELAKAFGGNHMTYARAFPKVRKKLRELEPMALRRLQPYFEERGVVIAQIAELESLT
jgi:hypothetical protein